jgi:hypothetical protein
VIDGEAQNLVGKRIFRLDRERRLAGIFRKGRYPRLHRDGCGDADVHNHWRHLDHVRAGRVDQLVPGLSERFGEDFTGACGAAVEHLATFLVAEPRFEGRRAAVIVLQPVLRERHFGGVQHDLRIDSKVRVRQQVDRVHRLLVDEHQAVPGRRRIANVGAGAADGEADSGGTEGKSGDSRGIEQAAHCSLLQEIPPSSGMG